MCGIVGIFSENKNIKSKILIEDMLRKINHRGPDDQGQFHDEKINLSLGMKRLTIVDQLGGTQPMYSEDKRFVLVFNGEIVNSKELRQHLIQKNISFKSSHSDTEVLLNLLIHQGKEAIQKLNGMFAFAFYDNKKKTLLLARDRSGIKNLYYYEDNNNLFFSSEIKSFFSLGVIDLNIKKQSVFNYLSLMYLPDSNTIFEKIKKLDAGSFILKNFESKSSITSQYFDLSFNPQKNISIDEWKERIIINLKESLNRWSMSDCPYTCSLSGGLDSSSIVAILSTVNKKIDTFSLGFSEIEESRYNELANARHISDQFGTNHTEVILNSKKLIEDLNEIAFSMDEPYGGGVPSWLLFKKISETHKVVFTGTGADEIFGSYGKWRRLKLLTSLKYPKINEYLFENFFFNRSIDGRGYYFNDNLKRSFLTDDFKDMENTSNILFKIYNNCNSESQIDKVTYLDFKTQLNNEFLNMTDKFSMAHSIEARPPFLDNEMINLMLNIPANIRSSFRDIKYLLRSSMQNYLPNEILSAPKKGFEIPLEFWLRNDLKDLIYYYFSDNYLKEQNIFKKEIFNELILPYLNNQKGKANKTMIWGLLMFQLWYDNLKTKKILN